MQQIGLDAVLNNVPDFTGGIDKMNRSVDSFASDATAAGKALASFEASAERAAKVQALTDRLDQQQKALGILQQELDKTTAKYGEGSIQAQKKQLALETLTKAIDRTETQLKTEATALDLEKQAAAEATPVVDKLGTTTKQAGDDAEKGGHGFDAFGEIVTGALRAIGELAVQALLKAGQAVAGFVKDSIGLAGDFQANMLEFQSVAGKEIDTKGLEDFHDLFLQLGKDLPVSTSEVQQAAIEMVKGGIDPATIAAGGLKQNIQFAAAAMSGDLVKAAEISSKILGGWAGVGATAAEKSDFLTHATDMLAKAANASSTDVEGLSRGIFNAQGIARTAGVSFDDLTTTLAALAPRFASSSEAGNSLKNMIVRLQPTTDPATEAMRQLGLYTDTTGSAFYDAQGNFVGFQQASELLKQSLVGLTKEQQAAALQTIFGNDAMGSASALAELGAKGYQEMADSLANANGVMDAAALKQQGFNTSLENAKGSVEALQITLGEKLLPILGSLIDGYVAPFVNILTDLAGAGKVSDETFNKLNPTMQSVAKVVEQFAADVQMGAQQAMAFGKEIGDLIAWFGSAAGSSKQLSSAVDGLSGVWQVALKTVQDVGNGYMAIAQAVLPIVQKFIADHGTQIAAFFQAAYDHIMVIVNTALQLYDAVVPKVLGSVAKWISDHATGIQAVLSGAWQAITAIIDGALAIIEGVLKVALDLINGDWSKAWDDIKTMSVAVVLDIGKVISGFFDIIAGLFNTSMADIAAVWQHNWDELYRIATETDWGQVGADIINGIVSGIAENAGKLYDSLKNMAGDALQAAKDALGISSPSKEFAAIGAFAVEGMMLGIKDTWPTLIDQVGGLSDDLIGKMQDIGKQIQSAIADSFGATASIDRQVANNLNKFKDVLPQYQQYVTGALNEAQQRASEFADPAQGAKYFKMKSDQILEYAKLQKDLSEATTQQDRDRISAQMLLINKAQSAEIAQFDATTKAQSAAQSIADQINDVMKQIAGIHLTDDQIKIVDMLSGVWAQLVTPVQNQRPTYNPGTSSTTNTTNLSMPIYTNQSPTVMQSSMAIAGAALL